MRGGGSKYTRWLAKALLRRQHLSRKLNKKFLAWNAEKGTLHTEVARNILTQLVRMMTGKGARAELRDTGGIHVTRAQGPRQGVQLSSMRATFWWDSGRRETSPDSHSQHSCGLLQRTNYEGGQGLEWRPQEEPPCKEPLGPGWDLWRKKHGFLEAWMWVMERKSKAWRLRCRLQQVTHLCWTLPGEVARLRSKGHLST
jgi:hypothetical protein